MSKMTELINSLNDENAEEIKEKLIAEATARDKANRQLYSRAKKAEGYEYDKQSEKWVKKEQPEKKSDKPEKVESNKNESDATKQALINSQKALLNSLGYSHSDEQEYILKEAERLKQDISQIIDDKYHKSKLTDMKDERKAQEGMPKGRGSSGSDVEKDVDYHLKKGTTPDDVELAEKVINARIKQSKGPQFSDDLHTGSAEF